MTKYEWLESKIRLLDQAMIKCINAGRWPMALVWCLKIDELESRQLALTAE